MKKILLLIILLVFPLVLAQNVFKSQKQIYLAEYYAHQKNDQKALDHYLEAIKINPKVPISDAYLEASSIAFKLKDNKNCQRITYPKYYQTISSFRFFKRF